MADLHLIDSELLEALVARLREDKDVFTSYGQLHEAKGSREGHEKAVANFHHATKIELLLRRLNLQTNHRHYPFTAAVNLTIDHGYTHGHNPVAIVATRSFLLGWYRELRLTNQISVDSMDDMIGSCWTGLTIYLAEDEVVNGVVAVGEGSVVLEKTRLAYA